MLTRRFAGLGVTIDDQSDRLDPILPDRGVVARPAAEAVMSTYLARVRHDGSIRIHRNDQPEPVAAVTLPAEGTSLRMALREAGWRPTWRAPGGGWGLIFVERLAPARERGYPRLDGQQRPPVLNEHWHRSH